MTSQANATTVDHRPAVGHVAPLVTALAIVAMAVDHLMGADPGLEDPPMFLIACVLTVALAALVFGRIEPRAIEAGREVRDALILSIVAVVPGVATLWLGLPFVLAGGAIVLGLAARERGSGRLAWVPIALGALMVAFGSVAYAVQFVDKVG